MQISGFGYYDLPFATDSRVTESMSFNSITLLYAYLPIPFYLFLFWGEAKELTSGYGKLLVIRNGRRSILCVRTVGRISLTLFAVVLIHTAVFSIVRMNWTPISLAVQMKAVLSFYLIMLSVILLQFVLELVIDKQSNLVINIIMSGSLLVGNMVLFNHPASSVAWILFPNLAFSSRNGLLNETPNVVMWQGSIGLAVFLIILFTLVSMRIMRKKDIY
jgi:hypothetical protein